MSVSLSLKFIDLKILVTGSTGMVGSNLVDKLKVNKSFDVYTPTRSELNLLSGENINSYLCSKKINLINHCAGVVGGIQMNI